MKKILVLMACASFMMCACDDDGNKSQDHGVRVDDICKALVAEGGDNDCEIFCEVDKNNQAELISSCEKVVNTMPVCKDELIAHLGAKYVTQKNEESAEEAFDACINKTDDTHNQYTDALQAFEGITCGKVCDGSVSECNIKDDQIINAICYGLIEGDGDNRVEVMCEVDDRNKAAYVAGCEKLFKTMPVCYNEFFNYYKLEYLDKASNADLEAADDALDTCVNASDETHRTFTDALDVFSKVVSCEEPETPETPETPVTPAASVNDICKAVVQKGGNADIYVCDEDIMDALDETKKAETTASLVAECEKLFEDMVVCKDEFVNYYNLFIADNAELTDASNKLEACTEATDDIKKQYQAILRTHSDASYDICHPESNN